MKQLKGLNTSISGVKKTVTDARKGLKRNTPIPVQQNMEDASTHIAELGSIQKLIETNVEGLKNGMAALQPRPIKSIARKKKETRREETERGQKRGASESPKIDGFSNTRSKPRLMSNRTRLAANGSRTSEQEDEDKSSEVDKGDWETVPLKKRKRRRNQIRKEQGLVQQQLPLKLLMEKSMPMWFWKYRTV